MILRTYVVKRVFWCMVAGAVMLFGLQLVFAFLAELGELSDDYQARDALGHIFYRGPYFWSQFAPVGVLAGAVVGAGLLFAKSEVHAMRAAGISLFSLTGWVGAVALGFGLVNLALYEGVIPAANIKAQLYKDNATHKISGHWLVDDGRFTHIQAVDATGTMHQSIHFVLENGQVTTLAGAPSGHYTNGAWQLDNPSYIHYQSTTSSQNASSYTINLLPDDLYLLTAEVDDLSLRDLMRYQVAIASDARHTLAFYQKLFAPIALVAQVTFALSFVYRINRRRSLGAAVTGALLFGLVFGYVQDLVGYIALAMGRVSAPIVLLPALIIAGIGLWRIHKAS